MRTQKIGISIIQVSIFIISYFITYSAQTGGRSIVYKFDSAKCKITWVGRAEVGDYNISGNIKLAPESFMVFDKLNNSGEFVMDMNSISCTSLNGIKKITLLEHLKGEDFFEVSKFSKAIFKITSVSPINIADNYYKVNGQMTIKGVSRNLSFPATIKKDKTEISIKSILKIDRTQFNITYNSKNFFDNLKDDYIKDEFDIMIDIVGY
ncbi:MAG: YceI family protein [Arcicella sp.]|jgi:polyisoprenoid-binding protein YceI|nr:YceI family protein [Arcicella sp.]